MAAIKTEGHTSERLLSIDWGKPPSGRQTVIPEAPPFVPTSAKVRVRIDEVFAHINAYRALVDTGISHDGLLASSLIGQANALFNQAFLNLKTRYGLETVFVDPPLSAQEDSIEDVTELVVHEVLRLQNILGADS